MESVQKAVVLLGDFSIFGGDSLRATPRLWRRRGIFIKQCEFIGVSSLGVIVAAGIFMGGVLGYQLYVSFKYFGAEALLGGSVGAALFRELGPVLGAVMVTGRAGASMAAEIASMRISEQIDALEVMAVDPFEYLVAPRIMAGLLMMPLLAVFFSAVASMSASLVACGIMGLDPSIFWTQFAKVVDAMELYHCVTKGAVFGLLICWVACFCGFTAVGGARSVGEATRNTVVASCLSILLSDYILTSLLPFGFPILKVT